MGFQFKGYSPEVTVQGLQFRLQSIKLWLQSIKLGLQFRLQSINSSIFSCDVMSFLNSDWSAGLQFKYKVAQAASFFTSVCFINVVFLGGRTRTNITNAAFHSIIHLILSAVTALKVVSPAPRHVTSRTHPIGWKYDEIQKCGGPCHGPKMW